jgi:hypothetical protein
MLRLYDWGFGKVGLVAKVEKVRFLYLPTTHVLYPHFHIRMGFSSIMDI